MLSKFESYIKDQFPYLLKEKSIVCCSGGVDSVVLFYLMLSVNKNFVSKIPLNSIQNLLIQKKLRKLQKVQFK